MEVLRTLLLALVGLGAAGLLVELTLLEHWMAAPQFVPWVTLTAVLVATVVVAVRPSRGAVLVFRAVTAFAVLAGLCGIGFHLFDNWAFEREVMPNASATALLWPVLQGATPLLAPGSLVQLGLAGLLSTYRHPALRPVAATAHAGDSHQVDAPAHAGDPFQPEETS